MDGVSAASEAQISLVEQLLSLNLQQALKPATDQAVLSLQLRAAGISPEGVGERVDVYA